MNFQKSENMEYSFGENDPLYRLMIESAPIAIFVHSNGKFVYANQETARLCGFDSGKQLINKPLSGFIHPDDMHKLQKTTLDGDNYYGKKRCDNLNLVRGDNTTLNLEITSVPILFEGSSACLAICADITERKKAEAIVLNHLMFLETLLDTIPNPIFYKDIHGVYLGCNTFFAQKILGLSRAEIIGKTVYDLPEVIPREFADIYHEHDLDLFRKSGVQIYESKVRCTDNEIRDFVFYKAVYHNAQNIVAGLVGVMVDITELKKVEKDLHRYQDRLRELTNSMTLTDEFERHRIASNLQEEIGQTLVVSNMKLGVLRKSAVTPEMISALDEVRDLIWRTIQSARSLTFELSPPVLHEVGLKAALEWLVEKFESQSDISYTYEDDGNVVQVDDNIRVMLFRATKELLFNVTFHSKATKASVALSQDGEYICIVVKDNGVGFNLEKIDAKTIDPSGFGIFSIRERMNHLGGRFEIQSEPGDGTLVTIVSPRKYYRR